MKNNFLERFYLVSKLTTSLLLFTFIIFLAYLLIYSYKKNDNGKSSQVFELKINNLSESINDNSRELSLIDNKIDEIIKQNTSKNITNDLEQKINNILEENKKLKIELSELRKELYSNNKKNILSENNKTNDIVNNLINLIALKYENGSNVNNELLLLQSQNLDGNKQAYIEKLFILSDKKFIGIEKLQNEFEILMSNYLIIYYKNKSRNPLIKYLTNFVSITPNYNSTFKNDTLKKFSIVKEKLDKKEIKSSLIHLSTLEDSDSYFKEWILEARKYTDFNENLKHFYNS